MEKKPYFAVLLRHSIYAGMFLLSKAAFDGGMNNFIFVFYRQAIATLFLLPIALYFEWKTAPPLSFVTFAKIFMLSLFGITICLDLQGVALIYTSASLAAATINAIPVITFLFALLFRVEVLRIKSIVGLAKVGGIVFCMGGVLVLVFYKGPQLTFFNNHHLFSIHKHQQNPLRVASSTQTWIKGCFLMMASNTLWALSLVLQAFVLKSYPSTLLFTSLQCLVSSFQSFFIAIALERNLDEWKLGWNLRLLSVAYCGIVATGVTYSLQTWVIKKKGPVFLAMSTPIILVITTISSALLLGESVSLGSGIGGLLLVGGLYSVLWGKNKEQKVNEELKQIDKECSLPVR
ncbi:WAT1-related protein At5g64700-like [Cucurbita pepo subsp. pepo]|uniref:WAT1-related protein At5g64700-like n=1 Tax=Cucurbita pepo subsp. pepo TaxID=3664 RepID=UPI000C9D33C3|nr:WAT1-related protein At5g64700-like [Cucurbita pepo subsp. pepo]